MEAIQDGGERFTLQTLSELRLDSLLNELTKRLMVVNNGALAHLVERGVLAPFAADGCCKPDGGTCCPNAKLAGGTRFDPRISEGR
jgi:hypothetical protein